MEELREAARYYRETASDEYKQWALKALDNGESLEDFYIRETKRSIRSCDVCAKLVVGFYFCCTKCELYNRCNYNLCVKCFYGGTFQHEHDSFADNHSVLMMHHEGRSEPSCVIEKRTQGLQIVAKQSNTHEQTTTKTKAHLSRSISSSRYSIHRIPSLKIDASQLDSISLHSSHRYNSRSSGGGGDHTASNNEGKEIEIDKAGIEKLECIAEAHYNAAPQTIRDSADKFFWNMVKQRGKTSVTQDDFLEWMEKNGHKEYGFPEFFQALVKNNGKKVMNMSESRTLYYILLSGRPFCSWCKCFIPDIYFCCSKCSAKKYALCLNCYANKAYMKHYHYGKDDVFFLDYTVLHTTIKTTTTSDSSYHETESSSSSMAIVERDDNNIKVVKTAWTVVKAALNVGSTVLSIASTLGACTIM